MSLISDTMVKKAALAQWDALRARIELPPFDKVEPERRGYWLAETRAGLEAVVGDIIEAFGAGDPPPLKEAEMTGSGPFGV